MSSPEAYAAIREFEVGFDQSAITEMRRRIGATRRRRCRLQR